MRGKMAGCRRVIENRRYLFQKIVRKTKGDPHGFYYVVYMLGGAHYNKKQFRTAKIYNTRFEDIFDGVCKDKYDFILIGDRR
jgi:hypothetical protein